MEPIEVPLESNGRGGGASKLLQGEGVVIRKIGIDGAPDWHTAPLRQMTATISGEGEIETGDGQKIYLEPGVVLLLEDTHGIGHITRTFGQTARIALFLPLNEKTTLL
jgi:quercetin dioxygenase-like cupin family protein